MGNREHSRRASANLAPGAKRVGYLTSPRVEIILTPIDQHEVRGAEISQTREISSSALYDAWLVLHVPDGSPPTTIRIDGGPFEQPL
jgi:hypothetical protein